MAYTPKPNKFATRCATCGAAVAAGNGFLNGKDGNGNWVVKCEPCQSGRKVEVPTQPVTTITTPGHPLTDEQQHVVDLVVAGKTISVEAGAGAGKTSTLIALGKKLAPKRGQYLAFNKDIVKDARAKFRKQAPNVNASTIHALGFRSGGSAYAHRWGQKGKQSARANIARTIATQLRLEPFVYELNGNEHTIEPRQLARYVRQAVIKFAQSEDTEVNLRKHMSYVDGIDRVDPESLSRDYLNNDRLQAHLQFAAETLWADYALTDGQLPGFDQIFYVKLWALGVFGPCRIDVDFILVDEAQDLNGVMLQVLRQQRCQVVLVGDTQQTINEWMGSKNALALFPTEETAWLTKSFRFGPEIAQVANKVLEAIEGAQLRLSGLGGPSEVTELEPEDINAILTRTNAGAVDALLDTIGSERSVYLVGETTDLTWFVRSAADLQDGGKVDHPELSVFESWTEVVTWVKEDPEGADLKIWVDLIERFGCEEILDALSNVLPQAKAAEADITISTTHKSKGREWDNVKIWGDWNANRQSEEEKRLAYVAATRAKLRLDYSQCATLCKLVEGQDGRDA